MLTVGVTFTPKNNYHFWSPSLCATYYAKHFKYLLSFISHNLIRYVNSAYYDWELVLKLNTLPTAFCLQNLGFLSLQTFQMVPLYFTMDFRISTNFICLDRLRYKWCRHAHADLSWRIQKDIEKILGLQQPESDLWGRWQWRKEECVDKDGGKVDASGSEAAQLIS